MSQSEQKSELVTFGYIRESCDELYIPTPLTKMIQNFYDLYIHNHFVNKKFHQFLNSKINQSIDGKSITIKGCTFKSSFNPNGWSKNTQNQCGYFLELINLPQDIEYISCYIEFLFYSYSPSQNIQIIFTQRFNQSGDEIGWPLNTLLLSQIIQNRYKYDQHLIFDYFIDIKHIKYKSTHQHGQNQKMSHRSKSESNNHKNCDKSDFLGDFKMSKYSNYNWKWTINQMAQNLVADKNWILLISKSITNKVQIGVQILSFPLGISSMIIKIDLEMKYNNINGIKRSQITNFGVNNTVFDISTTIAMSDIKHGIDINVRFTILTIFDDDMNRVCQESEWMKLYGITIN